MQVSTFQALCLLPDDEQFVWFVKYRDRRSEKIKLKRRRDSMTLEQVVTLVESSAVARLVRSPGFGWLVTVNQKYLKTDGKKSKALADEYGVKFKKHNRPSR